MLNKIYFDMDGVLADFDDFVKNQLGMEYSAEQRHWLPNDDEMWEKARNTSHFYYQLKLMDGAKELFDMVFGKYGSQCEILTGIPKPKRGLTTAKEDKIAWVRQYLSSDIVVNVVYKEEKPQFCTGKDCILIDDTQRNITEWEQSGGTGILHVSPENTIQLLKEMHIL